MKTFSKVFTCTLLLSSLLIYNSCKKETASTTSLAANKLPTANAGADQTIILPADSADLNGSATGMIISYQWSQISGPTHPLNSYSSLAKTKVKILVQGVYEFQLKVMNASGDSAFDYVIINVVAAEVGLVQVGQLSINRSNVAMATAGNKIFFAGGNLQITPDITPLSSRVDIYDISTKKWSTTELSEARCDIGAVAVGNKILFAGGANKWYGGAWGYIFLSTRVDIYDIITNTWSTNEMPGKGEEFMDGFDGTTTTSGNKAIFYGGFYAGTEVYIYDVSNNSWTTSSLSTSRDNVASASVGNKIFIAGSGTKNVDVYDVSTNLWTIDSLSESRGFIIASSLNNKVFFAGGGVYPNNTNKVDIYDNTTQKWSVAHLSRATALAGAASSGNKMYFFGGNVVDIYDTSTNTWSVSYVSVGFGDGSVFISAGGNVYATYGDKVWRVEL